MENTRNKNRKNKNYGKQKVKCATDEVDEKESNIFSSVDKIRLGRLPAASGQTSPVGNIVDMQGSLDHGSVEKNEDEKSENKNNNKEECNKDRIECDKAANHREANEKNEDKDDKDEDNKDAKSEAQTPESNDVSESVDVAEKNQPEADSKSLEKEDTAEQKSAIDETCESSARQSVLEIQGSYLFSSF